MINKTIEHLDAQIPLVVENLDPAVEHIKSFFQRKKICITLDKKFNGSNLTIEQGDNTNLEYMSSSEKNINLECRLGTFRLSSGEQILRALTGIDIGENNKHVDDDLFAFAVSTIPESFREALGWISPSVSGSKIQAGYVARIRLQTNDLVVTSDISGSTKFWLNMLDQLSPYFAPITGCIADHTNDFPEFIPLMLGDTWIKGGELSVLEVGDVILLDNVNIDSSGIGRINENKVSLDYQLIRSAHKYFIKII